jgi:hypothetical protein
MTHGHPGAMSILSIRADLDTVADLKLIGSVPTMRGAPAGSSNPSLSDCPAPRLP